MPTIKYSIPGIMDEEIITESAIVAQFLCDSFPSHLLPATREDPTAPLRRARINFFVDTWNTKIASHQMSALRAQSDAEKDDAVKEWAAAIEKEIEPLLADANPFFGGSEKLNFAEVIIAPFLLRWYAFSKDGELVPTSLVEKLDALPNFSKWVKAVNSNESALGIWDEKSILESFKARMAKMRQQK